MCCFISERFTVTVNGKKQFIPPHVQNAKTKVNSAKDGAIPRGKDNS